MTRAQRDTIAGFCFRLGQIAPTMPIAVPLEAMLAARRLRKYPSDAPDVIDALRGSLSAYGVDTEFGGGALTLYFSVNDSADILTVPSL